MTTTLSVRVDTNTQRRLDALARRARRSKSFLAAEAISGYVDAETPGMFGRGEWIRTTDPSVPNRVERARFPKDS